MAFDSKRLEVTGEPVVIAAGPQQFNSRGAFSVSANGILAFWSGEAFDQIALNWYARDGRLLRPALPLTALPRGNLNGMDLSLDGRWLSIGIGTTLSGTNRIWLCDLEQSAATPFGPEKYRGIGPVWWPGQRRLALGYGEDGPFNVSELLLDRPFAPQRLHAIPQYAFPRSISSDGSLLIYEVDFGSRREIWALSLRDRKRYPWIRDGQVDAQSQLAPGSSNSWWMAYSSNESGASQVYLENFTLEGRRGGRVQVSSNGGNDPRWRADGRELYFLSADSKLMSVSVSPSYQTSPPTTLFSAARLVSGTIYLSHRYAVSRDGRQFLMVSPAESSTEPLTVLVNWLSGLEPTGMR
ncbi:MAG: hypothetical protein HY820_45840 [Acidobacteria bacterium]|nr:hypothetical protein [Acidobacteriota bacterium]